VIKVLDTVAGRIDIALPGIAQAARLHAAVGQYIDDVAGHESHGRNDGFRLGDGWLIDDADERAGCGAIGASWIERLCALRPAHEYQRKQQQLRQHDEEIECAWTIRSIRREEGLLGRNDWGRLGKVLAR
jgi:hypothetical protein